jgi:hypothetical protein
MEPAGPGGVKAPAATVAADVIMVSGNLSDARLSQDAARTGDAVNQSAANVRSARILLFVMIADPPLS